MLTPLATLSTLPRKRTVELDELTEVFTMYADLKKATADGEIAISTLPKVGDMCVPAYTDLLNNTINSNCTTT